MRINSRAIIVDNDKLVTMFRRKIKDGVKDEYYVLPGGGQEEGETLEENVIRELKEELNVDIKILGYLGSKVYGETLGHYFHCTIVNGTPKLGGEELERMTDENYYEVRFIDLKDIHSLNLSAEDMVQKAINKEYVDLE